MSLPEWAERRICTAVSGCWEWTGHVRPDGYGQWKGEVNGSHFNLAHRAIYTLLVGPIPGDLTIDHLCRNKSCVNPDHLEVVTRVENTRRRGPVPGYNARKTHCKHGHEFTPENTWVDRTGHRFCRTCWVWQSMFRDDAREWRWRRREADGTVIVSPRSFKTRAEGRSDLRLRKAAERWSEGRP